MIGGFCRMHDYKAIAKKYLSSISDALRAERNLTQENMAEKLRISSRAYGDLERGKYCFSSTALLFMMNMMEDEEVGMLLDGFQEQVELLENQDDDRTSR